MKPLTILCFYTGIYPDKLSHSFTTHVSPTDTLYPEFVRTLINQDFTHKLLAAQNYSLLEFRYNPG